MKRDFNFSKEEVEEKVELILSFVEVITPSAKIEVVKEDPDDNKIVECAVESKSEYIIRPSESFLLIYDHF